MPCTPGQVISHYEILEQIKGRDPRVVFKARDRVHGGFVALKLLPPHIAGDPTARQEFIRQSRAISVLDHPTISTVRDILQTNDGQFFAVMPWFEGETLALILERGHLETDRALDIAISLVDGIARAHEAGISHLELVPTSILIVGRSDAKLLDFGMSRGNGSGAAADLWALAVVLFEMLTGTRPSGQPAGQRPRLSEVVRQILDKGLARDPRERYASARQFLSDLRIARGIDNPGMPTAAAQTARRKRQRRLFWRSLPVAGTLLLVLAALYALPSGLFREDTSANPRTILITSFQNLTGVDSLDYFRIGLQHLLITSLEQSVDFRPTSWSRLADLKQLAGRSDSLFIDEALGRELCTLDPADMLLTGSYSRIGDRFTVTARLIDVHTQHTLLTPVASGRGIGSFFEQVDHLSREISQGLGVPARRTRETIRPIEEITTRSQLAYQLTLAGWELVRSGKRLEAMQNFELAVKEDSLFAYAWIGLRTVYQDLGYLDRQWYANAKAVSLFDRASERDRLNIARIDTSLRAVVMGRPGATYLDFLRYRVQRFPKDKSYLYALGLELQTTHGRVDEAIDVFREILDLDPYFGFAMSTLALAYAQKQDFPKALEVLNRYASIAPTTSFAYHTMGDVHVMAGRYDDAIASYTRASAIEPTFVEHMMKTARVNFWREQYDEAMRWNDSAMVYAPSPGKKADLLWNQAFWYYWLGQLGRADSALREREILLEPVGNRGSGYLQAWLDVERGMLRNARPSLASWIRLYRRSVGEALLAPQLAVQYHLCIGFVDLREGRLDSAEARVAAIDRIKAGFAAADTSYVTRQTLLAADQARRLLLGELLLARGRPADVVALYGKDAGDQDWDPLLSVRGPGWRGIWGTHADIPVETDGLARAYAALGRFDAAIILYEAGLAMGHRTWGIHPRHHYRLARLYEQKGWTRMAILEYERFLRLWAYADPGYPEPADARTRLARLKQGRGS